MTEHEPAANGPAPARARLLLLLAVVIWGFTFVATKICLRHMTAVELMGLRLAIALPVLLAIVRLTRTPIRWFAHPRALLLGSGLIGVHFFIQINGLRYTSATNTGWIIAVTPLVMALLARGILGEPIRARLIVGITVATAGILLLVSGGRLLDLAWLGSIGDWLILASAHTWALYTVAVRDLSRYEPPLAVTFLVLVPATAATLSVMLLTTDWGRLLTFPLETWLALLFLGIFGMALAHWFWQQGVAVRGAAEAGMFLYLEPLATTALAVPYLHEPFGPIGMLGGLLVLGGVWWSQRPGPATRGR